MVSHLASRLMGDVDALRRPVRKERTMNQLVPKKRTWKPLATFCPGSVWDSRLQDSHDEIGSSSGIMSLTVSVLLHRGQQD